MSAVLKGFIRNGRVEVDGPIGFPEGAEVVVASRPPDPDEGPAPPGEIARVLAAMERLRPLEIPEEVADDLDAWERESNRRGIDRDGAGIEGLTR